MTAVKSIVRPTPQRPASSEVLTQMLVQAHLPHWSAWYVSRADVINDQWGQSHFNWKVDGVNYHVLRTGAFPFIKYHISKRPHQDLSLEDNFYRVLKVLNFGFPTLMYGLAGLVMATHTEEVEVKGRKIVIYFWYKENRRSPH